MESLPKETSSPRCHDSTIWGYVMRSINALLTAIIMLLFSVSYALADDDNKKPGAGGQTIGGPGVFGGSIGDSEVVFDIDTWTSHGIDDTADPQNEARSNASGLTPPRWLWRRV